ncbi:hypothetical protein [Streptomyces sp. NBC_00078]|uniref:hypothetical protein n=1 Tax=unclassified Streptomyces TaxID=2593676 RepID=UPI00224E90A6|nr:hypothetical protein [Streptomyces sp. NBC_00078]MCX5422627.1 hypothetical protein [Streptomyces sp. NBC_00078]
MGSSLRARPSAEPKRDSAVKAAVSSWSLRAAVKAASISAVASRRAWSCTATSTASFVAK